MLFVCHVGNEDVYIGIVKYFHRTESLWHEDKNIFIKKRIQAHLGADYFWNGIDILTHIHRKRTEIVPLFTCKGYHLAYNFVQQCGYLINICLTKRQLHSVTERHMHRYDAISGNVRFCQRCRIFCIVCFYRWRGWSFSLNRFNFQGNKSIVSFGWITTLCLAVPKTLSIVM